MLVSSYFLGKNHFKGNETQNCLVFQLAFKYFKMHINSSIFIAWKSKDLSEESTKPSDTPDNKFMFQE